MTENILLEKLRQGENSAFETVYEKGFPLIYKLVIRNNGTRRDAQDLMQDVIFSLVKNLQKTEFKLTCQLTTYMYSVGRNLWLTKLKANNKELLSVEGEEFIVIAENEIEQKQKQEERYQVVAEVLAKMKENCRKLIMAFYYKKTPLKEIAQSLNISPESMKVTKYRCMKELKKMVASNQSYQALID